MIVPGGGISLDGRRWVSCRPGFFLPVRVLSRLFRRLFLDRLAAAHAAGRLAFFGNHAALADPQAFSAYLAPLRKAEWVVYAKKPFGGPQAVLAYLSRYTHRVAISNSRLIACDRNGVTFRWKDYRAKGRNRAKVMRWAHDHHRDLPTRQRTAISSNRAASNQDRHVMTEAHLDRGPPRNAQMLFACSPAFHQPVPCSFKSRSANPMSRRSSSFEARSYRKNPPMLHQQADHPRHPSLPRRPTAAAAPIKSP
jgi:hypothetical protein